MVGYFIMVVIRSVFADRIQVIQTTIFFLKIRLGWEINVDTWMNWNIVDLSLERHFYLYFTTRSFVSDGILGLILCHSCFFQLKRIYLKLLNIRIHRLSRKLEWFTSKSSVIADLTSSLSSFRVVPNSQKPTFRSRNLSWIEYYEVVTEQ